MNQIILASHGGMAAGVKDTAQMIIGDLPNVHVVATTRDETESIESTTRRLLDQFTYEDNVYILTDVLGGSVNNNMISLLKERPDLTVICGMNLCLVLSIAAADTLITGEILEDYIQQAKNQIVNCTELLQKEADNEEEDL